MNFLYRYRQYYLNSNFFLQLKIIIVFLALSVLALTGIAVYSTIQNQQNSQNQITREQQKLGMSQKVMIDNWLNNLKANLDTVAALETGRIGDIKQVEADLIQFQNSWGIYENIYVTDVNGFQIAAGLRTRLDVSDRDYFQHAMQGETYYSGILISKVSGKGIIVISKPLIVANKIIGIIAIACQTTALNDVLNSSMGTSTGESYLIDSHSVFITPSRFTDRLLAANLIKERAESEIKINTFGAQQALQGIAGTSQYKNYLNDEVLGTYFPIETTGWGLLVEQSDQEIFAKTDETRNIVILISLFTALLIGVSTILITDRKKAMDQIQDQANELLAEAEELSAQNQELFEQDQALRQAEGDIRRLNAELEQRVSERTNQLKAANFELEAFTYSVSHDLRAPLRRITGYTQILAEDYTAVLDHQAQEYVERINKITRNMNELVEALLRLSKVNQSGIELTEVNLSAIAREIAHTLQDTQPEREVEFVIPECLTVKADAKLMDVLLQNLLTNAWKFSSKHKTARIELGSIEINNQTAYFVRDDGAGFNPSYTPKLFGVFQRLHPLTDFDGSGIGLALAQRIVHRHGGQIWAEGQVEQGATFYFTLV